MRDIKIITTTGYGCTGSSAVSDLIKEFKSIHTSNTHSVWLLQDFNGISDLEFSLTDGNHRSKTNLAIKNFWEFANKNKKIYQSTFGKQFLEITRNYINNLVDVRFRKQIMYEEIKNFQIKFFLFKIYPKIQRFFFYITKFIGFNKNKKFIAKFPYINKTYTAPNKKKFYKLTQKYLINLIKNIKTKKKINVFYFDQLVPSINSQRYLNYFKKIKIIIIDRDPRDLFILNKEKWHGDYALCDTTNVEEFVLWYKKIREHRDLEKKNKKIIYINFEDLIYNYEREINKITKFFNIPKKNHVFKKKFFKPEISMKETKTWEIYKDYKKEVKFIEKKLPNYCYKY